MKNEMKKIQLQNLPYIMDFIQNMKLIKEEPRKIQLLLVSFVNQQVNEYQTAELDSQYHQLQRKRNKQLLIMSSFSLLKDSLQIDLSKITNETTIIYRNQCTKENAQCPVQSVSQCQGFNGKQCIWSYPRQEGCASDGIYFSKHSGVRFPNTVKVDDLKNNQKLFVCASNSLDKTLSDIKDKYLDKIVRSYIGTGTGFFRAFPSVLADNINGTCVKNYNPSARPWYIEATTGSKNIIIVIDVSSSMSASASMVKNMQSSLQFLIGTMSFNNFIGVVLMKETSKIMLYHALKRATEQVKTSLINAINSLTFQTENSVNYQLAFQIIYTLFNNSVSDEYGSQCEFAANIVLFLTASLPTKGLTSFKQLSDKIDTWNKKIQIKFLPYFFGDVPDYSLLKSLSCKYQGSFFHIPQKDDKLVLSKNIRHYQKQLYRGINIDSPVCTAPYEDFNTKKRMITLSMPIYYYVGGTRYVFGAAGIDILMKVLQNNTISETQVVKQLVKCFPTQPTVLDPCYLQSLRPDDSKCNLTNCPKEMFQKECQFVVKKDILKLSQFTTPFASNQCCGMTETGKTILTIVLPVFALIFIIVGVSYLIYRHLKSKKKNNDTIKLLNNEKQIKEVTVDTRIKRIPKKRSQEPTDFQKQENQNENENQAREKIPSAANLFNHDLQTHQAIQSPVHVSVKTTQNQHNEQNLGK